MEDPTTETIASAAHTARKQFEEPERPESRGNYHSEEKQRFDTIDLVLDGKADNRESKSAHMM